MSAGIVGGLVGCTLGVLVGILGTFFCIRNANGAAARVTMIKWALIIWGGTLRFRGIADRHAQGTLLVHLAALCCVYVLGRAYDEP